MSQSHRPSVSIQLSLVPLPSSPHFLQLHLKPAIIVYLFLPTRSLVALYKFLYYDYDYYMPVDVRATLEFLC